MNDYFITPQAISLFESHLLENENSVSTIRKYLHDIKLFAEFADGRPIGKTTVLNFKAMLEQNYAVRSANSMLAALNSFFRHFDLHHLCVKQFKLQKEAFCSEDRVLTKEDYSALVKAAQQNNNERLSLVVQTICSTGIRVSELQSITLEAVKRGEALVSCKGKKRKIFIVKALQKKLLKFAKKNRIVSGHIFITKNGKPLDRCSVWRQMKSLCRQAKVLPQKVFPHNLRHLFARTFYEIEKDISKLADILGHSNINTTRIYTISSGKEHRDRLESMHLVMCNPEIKKRRIIRR